jgi:hypothetical protein
MGKFDIKGQSHIEIIFSFIMFIGAVIVIFIFITPINQKSNEAPDVLTVQREILEDAQIKVGKLPIILNGSPLGNCYNFDSAKYSGNYLELRDIVYPRRFSIYFSDSIPINNAPNKDIDCDVANYSIGIYSDEDIIYTERIITLKDLYEIDYESLKSTLGVKDDFSFNVKGVDYNIVDSLSVDRNIPSGVSVNSVELPIRIIDNNAKLEEYILQVRAW